MNRIKNCNTSTEFSQEKSAFQGNDLSPPLFNVNITELAGQLEQIPSPVLTLNNKEAKFLLCTVVTHITRTQVWFDLTRWSITVHSWAQLMSTFKKTKSKKKKKTATHYIQWTCIALWQPRACFVQVTLIWQRLHWKRQQDSLVQINCRTTGKTSLFN